MFFKSNPKPAPGPPVPAAAAQPAATGPDSVIFDVGAQDFEQRVLMASMNVPVLVDFWAPWCGPCKTLGPVLENAVRKAGGKVLMAKVNLDQNQELAAALRIQSVPTVYAFFQGRPVDAFQGAVPQAQVEAFIAKLLEIARQAMPEALDIPKALKDAAAALASGDLAGAQSVYSVVLQEDPNNAAAYAGIIRVLIAAGQVAQARQLFDSAPPEIRKSALFGEAQTALELAENAPSGSSAELLQKIAGNPDDHQARIDLSLILFAEGRRDEAVEQLLTSIAADRMWNEEQARKQLLKFFEAMGVADPLTIESRRKMSAILFS